MLYGPDISLKYLMNMAENSTDYKPRVDIVCKKVIIHKDIDREALVKLSRRYS
jgi:hypothetical protein